MTPSPASDRLKRHRDLAPCASLAITSVHPIAATHPATTDMGHTPPMHNRTSLRNRSEAAELEKSRRLFTFLVGTIISCALSGTVSFLARRQEEATPTTGSPSGITTARTHIPGAGGEAGMLHSAPAINRSAAAHGSRHAAGGEASTQQAWTGDGRGGFALSSAGGPDKHKVGGNIAVNAMILTLSVAAATAIAAAAMVVMVRGREERVGLELGWGVDESAGAALGPAWWAVAPSETVVEGDAGRTEELMSSRTSLRRAEVRVGFQ